MRKGPIISQYCRIAIDIPVRETRGEISTKRKTEADSRQQTDRSHSLCPESGAPGVWLRLYGATAHQHLFSPPSFLLALLPILPPCLSPLPSPLLPFSPFSFHGHQLPPPCRLQSFTVALSTLPSPLPSSKASPCCFLSPVCSLSSLLPQTANYSSRCR